MNIDPDFITNSYWKRIFQARKMAGSFLFIYQRVINHRILWKSPALGRGPSPYRPWDRPLHRRNWCSKRAFRWWFMVNLVNSIVFWRHNFVWAGMVVFLVLSKVAIFLPCQTYLILVILGGHHVMFGNGMPATRPNYSWSPTSRMSAPNSAVGGRNPAI